MNAEPMTPEYTDIPSTKINGEIPTHNRHNIEVCFRESCLLAFWVDFIKAVRADMYGDEDGRVYESRDVEVYLGPYDITVRHNYNWDEQIGGDSYCGTWEPYAELNESFEAIAVFDYDCNESLPGVKYLLNKYYKEHEIEIFNKVNE